MLISYVKLYPHYPQSYQQVNVNVLLNNILQMLKKLLLSTF